MVNDTRAPFIFRIAGWPAETIHGVRSPAFAADVDRLVVEEAQLRSAADEISRELHREVAAALTRSARAILLQVRRGLHRTIAPLDRDTLDQACALPGLSSRVRQLLAGDDAARRRLDTQRRELKRTYYERVAAECQALFRVAAGHRFRNALVVSNPIVAARWQRLLQIGTPPDQKMTATLWAYAMRAIGRATPNGLWGGVSIEDVGGPAASALETTAGAGQVHVKPNLNLFDRALRALRDLPGTRRDVAVRRNPTLTRRGPETWTYLREHDGTWIVVDVADDEALRALVSAADGERAMAVTSLAAKSGLDEHAVMAFVDAGVLWPAIDWPAVCSDPWHALEAVSAQLPTRERGHWFRVVVQLRTICEQLQSQLPDGHPDETARAFSDAHALMDGLLHPYGAAIPGDARPLIVDWVAPFSIRTSLVFRETVLAAIRRFWLFDRGGTGELLARAARLAWRPTESQILGLRLAGYHTVASPEPPLPAPLGPGEDTAPGSWDAEAAAVTDATTARELHGTLGQWTAYLYPRSQHRAVSVADLAPASSGDAVPPGAALVSIHFADDRPIVRVGSVAADFCAFYSRFDHLFARAGNPFRDWLVRAGAALQEVPDLQLADFAVRGAHDRNASLRPRVTGVVLDPFADDRPAVDADVDANGRLRLRRRGSRRRLVPIVNTAADLGGADPYAAWIQVQGQLLGRPSLLRPLPTFGAELDAWHHLPRLFLDGDIVISAERWHVPPDEGAALAREEGFEQFVAWRRLVNVRNLPELAYGYFGLHRTESLIAVDSVLAAGIVSRSLDAHPGWLRFQEAAGIDALWLRDANGSHYVAEMAATWLGDDAFWRELSRADDFGDADATVTA